VQDLTEIQRMKVNFTVSKKWSSIQIWMVEVLNFNIDKIILHFASILDYFRLSWCFFLCGLFCSALSSISDYMLWNGRILCNEFERIWKEAVVA
jgi:hypothetical protein